MNTSLQARLELAGNCLLAWPDPEREHLLFGGYEVAHDTGRWWDAVLRLEEAIGFAIPPFLEGAMLRNLQRLTDNPDGLLMNHPAVPGLADKLKINPHNFREAFIAFTALVRRRDSAWARQAGRRLLQTMDHCLGPDGRFDFTRLRCWGQVPATRDPSHSETRRGDWFDATATSGRSLEALLWFHEATGEPLALELAGRVARHHLQNSTRADGQVRPEILDPENAGHDHSYLGTLRGLLLYGLRTGERAYIDTVAATWRHGVRHRLVRESGWAPHDLGKTRFPNGRGDPVADPASAGDAAQIALWLALHAGQLDLLDDAERLVRARLLPAQMTAADLPPDTAPVLRARLLGGWAIHGPPHAGKGTTLDVLAAVAHTFCDLHCHSCTPAAGPLGSPGGVPGCAPGDRGAPARLRPPVAHPRSRGHDLSTGPAGGLQVNLLLDYEDDRLRIAQQRDATAEVRVWLKQPGALALRIPGWADPTSVRVAVNGQPLADAHADGAFVRIPAAQLPPGSEILLTHDLPERETEEVLPAGSVYRFRWRGDEIVGVAPQEGPFPFYPPL